MAYLNLDLFKGHSHEKYYFLGFVAADGCIYDKSLIISLHEKDVDVLYKFCDWLKLPHTLVKKKGCCYVDFRKYNQELVNCILEYGITSRKTKVLKFPDNIPDEFKKSFILGYFDGDGSCYTNKDKSKLFFQIVGTQHINQTIKSIYSHDLGYDFGSIQQAGSVTRLIINGCKSSIDFGNWLYEDNVFCFERKKVKYLEFRNKNIERYNSGLNMKKAKEIRNLHSSGNISQVQLAKDYNVARQTIYDVLSNKLYYEHNNEAVK